MSHSFPEPISFPMDLDLERSTIVLLNVSTESQPPAGLEEYLSDTNWNTEILTATTPEEAVRLAEDRQLTGVIARYDLPDEDGITVLSECLDRQPELLTILVADQPSESVIERAFDTGIDEVVPDAGQSRSKVISHHVENYLGAGDTPAGHPRTTRHMEALASTASDAIVSVDETNVIRYANPAVASVFGYDPAEVIGKPLTMLMPDSLADRHLEEFRRYLRTGERTLDWEDIELTGKRKDGEEIPISISFSEFTTDDQRYFTGIVRDIRERKRREDKHELYHETTQQILQAESFETGLEIALDSVGSAMDWHYGEAWIRAADDHLERTGGPYTKTDAAETFAARTSPVSFERGNGLVGRVWNAGSPEWITDVTADDAGFERRSAASDAGLRAALGVPVESDGQVVAVMVFLVDESREFDETTVEATRKIADDLGRLMQHLQRATALSEERRLKNRILETSPVGIVILEGDGTFRYINGRARDILGIESVDGPLTYQDVDVDPLEFEGEPVADENLPHRRVIEEGEELTGEASVEVDGETRWVSVNGVPLYEDEGTAAVFAIQDITPRKQRERRLQQYEAVMQTVSDGLYALDDDGRFVVVNDAYTDLTGYDRDELIGMRASEFIDSSITDDARALQEQIQEGESETATLEATLTTADGDLVPVEARISLFELDDETHGRAGVVRDISDRKRRESRLARLNEIGQSLSSAETPGEVADVVVEGGEEILDLPLIGLEYYDEESGRLRPGPRTPELEELVGEAPIFESDRGLTWQVYAENQGRVIDDFTGDPSVESDESVLESGILLPVGSHGVFVAGSTETDAFTETDEMVARILVENAVVALERVAREQELRQKKDQLQSHNESLERVNRLNSLIRNLTRELTQASTREEIENAVCRELTGGDPYVFAWIGDMRAASDEVVPRESAGREQGYLDAISVTGGNGTTSEGPTGTALRTGEPAVQNNLHADPPFEPWRTQAIERGFHASIAVPLTYRDTIYGVLNLYAGDTGVFDDMEVAVLSELGDMIGYAINAIERKKALVSDKAVELTFDVGDASIPAVEFAKQTDSEFEFETLIERGDGTFRVFFTVTGVSPEDIYEHVPQTPSVRDVSLITELDSGYRYEAIVSESGFLGELIAYGAHPTTVSAGPQGGRITVELPRSGDVQSFVRMFLDEYESAELVSRVERDRTVQTREEFEANYRDRLTERQTEVLKTAYFSGFFEWPRETSGEELASKLGVSQPTVSRHIRTGERKLFDIVFDEDSDD